MARARDLHNYVERRQNVWVVVWKDELHSVHLTQKRASITLWKLKKIHKVTGAEPIPLSRLDRLIREDWLESQSEEISRKPPIRPLTGLPCPDCGGTLYLRSGKFGLFYGCENYSKTLCRGAVSANAQGVPLGPPVNAETRRARYLIRYALTWLKQDRPLVSRDMTLKDCQAWLAELCRDNPGLDQVLQNAPSHYQLTRLERLVADDDPLDEMLGVIGVDLPEP